MSKGTVTRERIVGKALALASLEGLDAVSIGELASDVGMSKSGLFAHFRSKEALQLEVLAAAITTFNRVVTRPALAAPRGEPRVRAIFEHWLTWEQHDSIPGGCVFVHAAAEWDDRPGAVRDALVKAQREWMAFLAGAVQRAIDVGHFRPDVNPEQFAFQMLATALGYYHAKRLLRDPEARAKALRAFCALVESAK